MPGTLAQLAFSSIATMRFMTVCAVCGGWPPLWGKRREPAITACRKAVALNPNFAEVHLFLSMCLSSAGMGEEALYYIEKKRRLNPHSSPFYELARGQAYFVLEGYDKAIAAFERGCELSATFPPNHIDLCITYALLGREEEMRPRLKKS